MPPRNNREQPFEIYVSELAEGLEAAKREGAERVRIRAYKEVGVAQNLSFDALSGENSIRAVSIADDVKVGKFDPTGLYEAENLRELWYLSAKVKLDFRQLSRLEVLYAKYNDSFEHFDALTELRDLSVVSMPTDDGAVLGSARKLQRLRLSGGKLRSLDGIDQCHQLGYVGIGHLPQLRSIDALGRLTHLTEVLVESCRHLSDYSGLSGAEELRKLTVRGALDSVGFIEKLPNLEELYFDNLVDADFAPLLSSASLHTVSWYPDKRHYPMKLAEFQERLDQQRAEQQ